MSLTGGIREKLGKDGRHGYIVIPKEIREP